MSGWNRKRHPDDVPTPVAVAVADFCRRAKAAASPALVRDALSLLTDRDDGLVRSLTDEAPEATPLGPFAVVDIIKGTPASLAADRQNTGYYEMVRLAAQAEPPPEVPPTKPVPRSKPSSPGAPTTKNTKRARQTRLSVSDKIAPKKRLAGTPVVARPKPQQPLPGTAFLPKRHLPPPRGRFTRLDSSRSTYETLLKPEAKENLVALVEQSPTRFHVFQTLEAAFTGRSGAPLSISEVEGALSRHGLLDGLSKRERDKVLTSIATARGSVPAAARELGVRPADIDRLVAELRLKKELQEIKEVFIREALDPANLSHRLSMLGRQRYLADLKIEKRFTDALTRDVTRLLDDSAEAANTVDELVELVAKKHAIVPDLLNRAVDRLGLTRRYMR
jgi:hypothetical protein